MPTTDGERDPRTHKRLHPHHHRDLHLEPLRLIDAHPTWTQRQLAGALGVSLGKAALRQELRPNDAGLGQGLEIDDRSLERAGA